MHVMIEYTPLIESIKEHEMSDLILSLIDERLQSLAQHAAKIATQRDELERERNKLVKLAAKSETPAKSSKPKAAARKASGPSVKEQILTHLRIADGPVKIAEIVAAIEAKNTTVNGTLHQLKKAGQVTNTADGWAIAMPAANHNGGAEARA